MAKRESFHEELTFAAISGLAFPRHNRKYLANLMRDVVVSTRAPFVIVAGHTLEGKDLEKEYKAQVRYRKAQLRKKATEAKKIYKEELAQYKEAKKRGKEAIKPKDYDPELYKFDEGKFRDGFEEDLALGFDDFLPKIEGVNYHFVISEKVFDQPIGARVLKRLRDKIKRGDVRLIGERIDGTFDPEVKIPLRLRGVEPLRVIVPRKAPWFYRIITSFMQRLIGSFVPRTFSQKPSLIIVGCAGTNAYLPFYEGVPCVSVGTLHKIDEQRSTENMVSVTVIKMVVTKYAEEEKPRVQIIDRTYDFRPVVAKERELTIPQKANKTEQLVFQALSHSPASPNTILFRINTKGVKNGKNRPIGAEQLKETLDRLIKEGVVQYRKYSNHYVISEQHRQGVKITLADLLVETKIVKHAVTSCFHGGALKTLYHTDLNYLPGKIWDADAWVDNGDQIQGLAHQYEYNGEVLPGYNGTDKQEILTAAIRARNILEIFQIRLQLLDPKERKKFSSEELIQKCLIKYVFEVGNHPSWGHHNKQALILWIYESELKKRLVEGILEICEKEVLPAPYPLVRKIVEEKVTRVGETKIADIEGVLAGVKHPFKGRTLSKSHRIQDVTDFIWRVFQLLAGKLAKLAKGFALTYVGNFHEAAAVHVVKFNETTLGVMTGAYLKDTQFETNNDKVVDFGHALVTACLNKEGRLVYSEVEFDNYIHPDDERIVFADRIRTSDVLALSTELAEIVDLPWR